ncbi:YvrJ family protein [Bacillus sp. FJAT-45037]|uniref:YvrJ family protein n=1 Tax=Bacillus sp. FJAT-45037 TaxID=2011007 RepID=UPI000C237AE0|nr:YvrJ family protein [Bacillus sp. FJAT-45037]
MTGIEIWLPILSEYGFPVMVTLYLLYRLERKLDLVIEAVGHLGNPKANHDLSFYQKKIH